MNDFSVESFEKELHNILGWWATNMPDSHEGFIGRVDGLGKAHPVADRGIVLNARILWAFSAAASATGKILYTAMAERAFYYIIKYFEDPENGGYFWLVDWQGKPVDTKKQIYAQAFVIYAFTEYYMLTSNPEALDKAKSLFVLIENKSYDQSKNGYFEAMTMDWRRMDDVRLSDKDANEVKTMNTHLHLLESYTNLYRCDQSTQVFDALSNLILLYKSQFIDPQHGRLKLFFDEDWNENLTHHSFGHEIESVWLLNEAAHVLGDNEVQSEVKEITLKIAHRNKNEGIHPNGAVYNDRHLDGWYSNVFDWWPQAEGVIGFYDAYEKSGEKSFKEAAVACWNYIKNHLIDYENGEWYWGCDMNNQPVLGEDKAGPWKAPYHNSRMCLEMMKRLKIT